MKTFKLFLLLILFASTPLTAQTSNLTVEQQSVQKLFQNLAGTWVNNTSEPNFEAMKLVFTPRHDNLFLELQTFLKIKGEEDWQPQVLATYLYDKETKKIHGMGMDKMLGYSTMRTVADFESQTFMNSYLRPLTAEAPVIVKITHALQEDGSLAVGNILYMQGMSEWNATFEKID